MASTGYSSCKSAVITRKNPAGRKNKAQLDKIKQRREIEIAKNRKIMAKPITTISMYDFMPVKYRINCV